MINSVTQLPAAYDLIRGIARHANRFWCGADLADLPRAPIYLFRDSTSFDSDAVDRLAQSNMVGRLHLPHQQVLFEVTQRKGEAASLVTYARETSEHIEAYLFQRCGATGRWTDVLCRAAILPDGVADTETHPSMEAGEEADRYRLVLTGMVWRSVGLLSLGHPLREHSIPVTRRPKLARAGVVGWTYRVAEIDFSHVQTEVARRGGTHASPRWHIRRGHWRSLSDGRRVFVRECQVGDIARGGVVKDYQVELENAA